MKMAKLSAGILLCFGVVLLFSGCSTVRVPVKVIRPAEINMSQYRQIAIGDIEGNMGGDFGYGLKNTLIQGGRFKIVDRSGLDQILKELTLSQSGLADEKNRVKPGKLMSASALITGRVEGRYSEELTRSESTCYNYKTEKREPCTYYYRRGRYSTRGGIDVIDVQTGEILRSKVLDAVYKDMNSATDALPAHIDRDSLRAKCLRDNIATFVRAISPWAETVMIPFVKDSAIPDLERGINQAKMGEIQEALKIFASSAWAAENNAKIKPEVIAKAYWDLGLAYEYTYEYDKAIEAFKKAYALAPRDRYIKEMSNAERLRIEKEKLDEQMGRVVHQ